MRIEEDMAVLRYGAILSFKIPKLAESLFPFLGVLLSYICEFISVIQLEES